MKKTSHSIIIIVVIVLFLLSIKWISGVLTDFSVMTKDIMTFEELKNTFKDKDILIPDYPTQLNNPYLHTAVESISVKRSKQYGVWDGTVIM